MPSAVVSPRLRSANDRAWPGPLRRLYVRLRADKLDSILAAGADPSGSVELSLRAGQLVGETERQRTADRITKLLEDPADRNRIEANRAALERIAEILRGDRYIPPRGAAMARRLLTDFRGPIHTGGPAYRLPEALADTLAALES